MKNPLLPILVLLIAMLATICAADNKLLFSLIGNSLKDISKWSVEKKFGQETEAKMANSVRNFENQFKLNTGFTDLHFGKINEILNLKNTQNELAADSNSGLIGNSLKVNSKWSVEKFGQETGAKMANTVRNFENQFKLNTGFTDLDFRKTNEILNLKNTQNELAPIVEFFQNVQKMETQNSAFATIKKLQYEKEESKVVKISNSQTKPFSALTINVPNNPDCKSGTGKCSNKLVSQNQLKYQSSSLNFRKFA